MTGSLSNYKSIESHLFVRIEVEYYKSSPEASPTSQILKFSDLKTSFTINSESYVGLGNLMAITASNSELRSSSGELSITISGIPNSSNYEIVNSRIKGSPVKIYRGLFDPISGALLDIEKNPVLRYSGFVNNYSLQEDYNIDTRSSTNTILLICNSTVDVLQNKISGRKTNPVSEKRFYPNDLSMDRVPSIENASFNFGAPK